MRCLLSILLLSATAVTAAQTPIKGLPFVIEKPGAYALARTLGSDTDGLIVNSSHVSIDLRGHALMGRVTSGDGVVVRSSVTDVAIFNGTISGWGGAGVKADEAFNVHLRDLRVSGNGSCGVRAGHGAVVDRVVSQANGGSGIQGFESLVVSGVSSTGNGTWGIEAGDGAVLTGNTVAGNFGGGLFVVSGGRVTGNSVVGNGLVGAPQGASPCGAATLAGIAVLGSGVAVSENTVVDNAIGLQVMGTGSHVAANVVGGNALDYQFQPGNQLELLVSELPLRIEWPAKVTLAGTLLGVRDEHGLVVASDGVTIDLAGHGLVGGGGEVVGILVEGELEQLVVRNGFVRGWLGGGILADKATGSHFEDLLLEDNGVQGLATGDACVVSHCVLRENLLDGLHTGMDCLVTSVSATGNGKDGMDVGPHSQVLDSVASENTMFGIRVSIGGEVRNSTASRNNMGIAGNDGCTIAGCTTSFNIQIGIRATEGCNVDGNMVHDNETGIAIVEGPGSRVAHNNLSHNGTGVLLAFPGNLAYCNTTSNNSADFTAVDGNAVARIYDVTGDGDFWLSDPWGNLSY